MCVSHDFPTFEFYMTYTFIVKRVLTPTFLLFISNF